MGELLERAVNPQQYDFVDIDWTKEDAKSPTRMFFYEYLRKYEHMWVNADILDAGCGIGWLVDLLMKNGANSVVGIDPSEKNVMAAKRLFPFANISQATLESFSTKKQYDLIIAVMVLLHVRDVDSAFRRLHSLLRSSKGLQVVVPDYEHFRTQRFGYDISFEEINDDEYVAQVVRPFGILADVVRKNHVYTAAASRAGFRLVEEVPMPPTPDLLSAAPKYLAFKDKPLTHLLRFEK